MLVPSLHRLHPLSIHRACQRTTCRCAEKGEEHVQTLSCQDPQLQRFCALSECNKLSQLRRSRYKKPPKGGARAPAAPFKELCIPSIVPIRSCANAPGYKRAKQQTSQRSERSQRSHRRLRGPWGQVGRRGEGLICGAVCMVTICDYSTLLQFV